MFRHHHLSHHSANSVDIRRITSEDGIPVTLDTLRLDLRIDDADESDTLKRVAQTAAALIEARSGYVLVPGTFEAVMDSFFEPWVISRTPYRDALSLQAMTDKGVWTTVETDDFQVIERKRDFIVQPYRHFCAPLLYTHHAGIKFRFTAGFDVELESGAEPSSGDGSYPLDPLVRGVFIALVGHYYKNRELFEADKLTEIESTAGGLLNSIRRFW